MDKIGVIGLGRMGSAIAARFASQDVEVHGWTRSGRRVEGVSPADDISTLVALSDVIVTSLFDDKAVAQILDALLDCDLTNKLIVETSTVTAAPLRERLERIEAIGGTAVDAPISGGPEMVQAGVCGVFIGGSEDAAKRAKKVLLPISGRTFHVGPLGTGLAMKAINNSMLQIYMSGLQQLLSVACEAGLPLETVLTILNGGPAGLPFMRDRTPKVLGDDDEVGFALSAAVKDNAVFMSIARFYGVEVPALEMAGKYLKAGVARGYGEKDPAHFIAESYIKSSIIPPT